MSDRQARSAATPSRCERCGRFVGEDASEGWSGGLFGDYNGRLYCANGVGCNRSDGDPTDVDAWFEVDHAA